MALSLTTTQRTATRADHVIPCTLVRIDLDSATLRFALAGHDIKDGAVTWRGAGGVASIERIQDGIELQSRGVRMSLSGVNPALVSAALSEPLANRAVAIYTAFFDRDTHKRIGDPVLDWAGVLDTMQVVTEPRKQ